MTNRRIGALLAGAALLTVLGSGAVDAKKNPAPVPQAITVVGTNPQTGYLTSTVPTNAATYTDGPTLTLTAGTYLLTGQVLLSGTGGVCQLTDGTTVISSAVGAQELSFSGFVTTTGATLRIACKLGGANIYGSLSGYGYPENGNTVSSLTAYKTS